MWQFAEAVRGLADGCQELGIPVTGGNVSFYNQTGATPIHPTPVVGVLGVLDDVARAGADGLRQRQATRSSCSARRARSCPARSGPTSPTSTSAARRRRSTWRPSSGSAGLLAEAAAVGHLTAAHDLSDGGLAQALVESCLRRGFGAHVTLPPDEHEPVRAPVQRVDGRVWCRCAGQEAAFAALAGQRGVPCTALGIVAGTSLAVEGLFEIASTNCARRTPPPCRPCSARSASR